MNIRKFLPILLLSQLFTNLHGMESSRVPRLSSLCSTVYLETIKDKDIDECFNVLKDALESGYLITISNFLLEQSDETEDSIQKKLTIAYCLALYFQGLESIEEDSSTIRTIPQLIIDIIYLHPYLNWNETQSPYTLALSDKTINEFVKENKLEQHHESLLKVMHPQDACLLEKFIDFENVEELGSIIEEYQGAVDFSICNQEGKSIIRLWCDYPNMSDVYPTTKLFLIECLSNPLLEHQRHLLLEPEHGVLECVAHWGDLELTQKLLELNTDPNGHCPFYGTALQAALAKPAGVPMRTMDTICKLLLDAGADPNATNSTSCSPLHDAAANKFDNAIKLLLQFNADPSVIDVDGDTPLHRAVDLSWPYSIETEEGDDPDRRITNTIRLLLEHDADPSAQNNKNETPLDIARQETPDNYELLFTFYKKGTKRKRPS